MTKLALLVLTITTGLYAQQLHPDIFYPKGHRLEGTKIDTALVGAPVELTAKQARSYFPDFNPRKERAFSNVGSGLENEFFIVKVETDLRRNYKVDRAHILHGEFTPGFSHGSFLFTSSRGFEFVPQNQDSKKLKPFTSKYLVGSFEGLRKRGMGFNAQNALLGDFFSNLEPLYF